MTDLRDLCIRPDVHRVRDTKQKPRVRKFSILMEPMMVGYIEAFQKFKPGESFFIEGVAPKEVEFLRRPILRSGVGITIRKVDVDPIYQKPGVRIWRQSGPYDDL